MAGLLATLTGGAGFTAGLCGGLVRASCYRGRKTNAYLSLGGLFLTDEPLSLGLAWPRVPHGAAFLAQPWQAVRADAVLLPGADRRAG